MGIFRLILKFGLILDLKNFFYVPPFSRNWIFVSKLCNIGYGFLFDENIFNILKTKVSTSGGTLINDLYKINLDSTFELNYLSMHVDSKDQNKWEFLYVLA